MKRSRVSALFRLILVMILAGAFVAPSRAQTADPASRGLDLFADVPKRAPAGARVAIPLRTFGFTSTTVAKPLGKVTVDASWEGAKVDDKPVTLESDADGLGVLTTTMPEGAPGPARLVLAVRFGEHRRTRVLSIEREAPYRLELSTPSSRVVAGESTTAWVRLLDRRTEKPAPNRRVQIRLLEGGVPVRTQTVSTDASGSATALLSIPQAEQAFEWELSATALDVIAGEPSTTLSATSATPSKAWLYAKAPAEKLRLGTRAVFRVTATSSLGEPMAGVTVHGMFLRDGEEAPEGTLADGKSAFDNASKRAVTDDNGVVEYVYDAPSTIIRSQSVRLVARAVLEGREDSATAGPLTIETRGTGSLELTAEDASLVPALEQSLYVRIRDGFGEPVKTGFRLQADGLDVRATSDERGFANVSWKVPRDVGTRRERGPCSDEVATSVRVTLDEGAPKELRAGGPLIQCLPVDRKTRVLVRAGSRVVRAGEAVELEVIAANADADPQSRAGAAIAGPVAVDLGGTTGWLTERDASNPAFTRFRGKLVAPENRSGHLPVRAVVLRDGAPGLLGVASLLEKPRQIPKLSARVTGGRSVPGGTVSVEATLEDEQGRPLTGSVAAMVVDAATGDYDSAFTSFDTRRSLCDVVDVGAAGCDAVLSGPASVAVLERLARLTRSPWQPDLDPGRTASTEIRQSFTALLKSLEGGVFEASSAPERVRDVLRVTPKGASFNPELFTVVTQAMVTPPLTPGGEPMTLADLVAVDAQVDFDHVARRVARLKLFRLLVLAREFRHDNDLDEDEPALKDPNALLRRFQLQGKADMLNDPWGHSFAFVASKSKVPKPFLSPIPGFELVSPGPDGKLGSGDDIADPFARVVKTGSPYAQAMGEDRIADAWLDMRVAESSINAWKQLMDAHTGTALGDAEGAGSGSGRLGGSHRSKPPQVRMGATSVSGRDPHFVWRAPVRTDDKGVARFEVPLGADETTYRIIVLGMPDTAGTAVATTDVKAVLPVSVRVFAGDRVTQGDQIDAFVTVTNRTTTAIHGELEVSVPSGGALKKGDAAKRSIDVGPGKKARIPVGVLASGVGKLSINASITAAGHRDAIQHELAIDPPGRVIALGRSRYVAASTTITAFAADDRTSFAGPPALVVESGALPALEAALRERWITDARTSADVSDAVELFDRVRRYSETMGPSGESLRERAKQLGTRATGRFLALPNGEDSQRVFAVTRRAQRTSPVAKLLSERLESSQTCPPEGVASDLALLDLVENEPAPLSGSVESCWDATIQAAMSRATTGRDAGALARLVLAFAERDHRKSLGADLAGILAREVKLTASGAITLPSSAGKETRVVVYAALVRARAAGWVSTTSPELLFGWLSVQRAADGGYGTIRAARAALSAILAVTPSAKATSVRVTAFDSDGDPIGGEQRVTLREGSGRLELDAKTASLRVDTDAGVLVRLERTALKKYRAEAAAQTSQAPVTVRLKYPGGLSAGGMGSLEVAVRAEPGKRRIFTVRVPLPPGVTVREELPGMHITPGLVQLKIETDDAGIAVPSLVPLRFSLGGNFLAPPAEVTDLDDASVSEVSTAARILVERPQ